MKKLTVYLLTVLIISFSVINTSCKKDEEEVSETPQEAPEVPPLSTFLMDFSNFSNPDDTLNNKTTFQHWGHSFANAAFWNTVITIGLAVPVASFTESFNHPAVYDSENQEWYWTYTVTPGNIDHICKLTASISGNYIIWKMFITKVDHFDNFMWYEGKSHLDGTTGYWILYKSPTENFELLQIDWNRASNVLTDIKYTNIEPDGDENGGYIFYGLQVEDSYDAFYDIYNKGVNNLTSIRYHRTNKNGKVKDPAKFGDDEWRCWDTTLADTDCN